MRSRVIQPGGYPRGDGKALWLGSGATASPQRGRHGGGGLLKVRRGALRRGGSAQPCRGQARRGSYAPRRSPRPRHNGYSLRHPLRRSTPDLRYPQARIPIQTGSKMHMAPSPRRGAYSGDPRPIGPGICSILHVDFRESPSTHSGE
jgi:hypothetical protein